MDRLTDDVQKAYPGLSGFSSVNVWRLRALYVACRPDPTILSRAVTELPRKKSAQAVPKSEFVCGTHRQEEMCESSHSERNPIAEVELDRLVAGGLTLMLSMATSGCLEGRVGLGVKGIQCLQETVSISIGQPSDLSVLKHQSGFSNDSRNGELTHGLPQGGSRFLDSPLEFAGKPDVNPCIFS